MKACTDKQRQWLWFAALWCGGIAGAFFLAYAVRWVIAVT
jgi:hypothetical protein